MARPCGTVGGRAAACLAGTDWSRPARTAGEVMTRRSMRRLRRIGHLLRNLSIGAVFAGGLIALCWIAELLVLP